MFNSKKYKKINFAILIFFVFLTSPSMADANREAQIDLVCFYRYVCSKYSDVAKECATAGNFDKCMRVKLNINNNFDPSRSCEYSGQPKYSSLPLSDPSIKDINDFECYADYAELKLGSVGHVASMWNRIKIYLDNFK